MLFNKTGVCQHPPFKHLEGWDSRLGIGTSRPTQLDIQLLALVCQVEGQ
jgi:hypothetical protein